VTVIGLDLGHRTTVAAEHWLAQLPPLPGLLACTHLVHGARPRVVITLAAPEGLSTATLPAVPGPGHDEGGEGAGRAAAADHAAGRAGRAVIFPGVHVLTGTLRLADLLSRSAIERVHVLGGGTPAPDPETLVDTRDFVRPQWMDGRLTLVATAAPAGRIAPFEVPNPTPCCGGGH
jgi:hypothetical protein